MSKTSQDGDRTILVIDDDPGQLELIREQLPSNVRLFGVTDGLEGYALACSQCPSAVVLDIGMPLVDGWTVLRKLRNNPATSNVPIIIVTGLDPVAIAVEAARWGVARILRKPYDANELRKAVADALERPRL